MCSSDLASAPIPAKASFSTPVNVQAVKAQVSSSRSVKKPSSSSAESTKKIQITFEAEDRIKIQGMPAYESAEPPSAAYKTYNTDKKSKVRKPLRSNNPPGTNSGPAVLKASVRQNIDAHLRNGSPKKAGVSRQAAASRSADPKPSGISKNKVKSAQNKAQSDKGKSKAVKSAFSEDKDFSELHPPYREEPVGKTISVNPSSLDGLEVKSKKKEASGEPKKRIPLQIKTQTETFTDLQSTIPVVEGPKKPSPFEERSDREQRRKKEEKRIYFFAAAALLIAVSVFLSFRFFVKEKKNDSEYADLEKEYVAYDPDEEYKDYPHLNINFASLYAVNDDIIGWLYAPDVNISLPIVKGEDNSFYSDHGFDGEESENGCLFTDFEKRSDFLSFVSCVYGKSMTRDLIQESLNNYLSDKRLEKSNSYFYIYLVNKTVRKYRIYSIFRETENISLRSEYSSIHEKRSFIETISADNLLPKNSAAAPSAADSFAVISAFDNTIEDKDKFILAAVFEEAYSLSKK